MSQLISSALFLLMLPPAAQLVVLKFTIPEHDLYPENMAYDAYPTTGVIVGDKLVLVSTSYADVPRTMERAAQHPDVKIHEVALAK